MNRRDIFRAAAAALVAPLTAWLPDFFHAKNLIYGSARAGKSTEPVILFCVENVDDGPLIVSRRYYRF